MIRLNKYLADAGICSRREADAMIEAGRVSVDGRQVREMGTKVDPERAAVVVDGRAVQAEARGNVYLALNKPRGVVSTMKGQHGQDALSDLIPPSFGRLFPVGRLDKESQGLVLMTNDGELANRLMHPRYGIERVYVVSVDEPLTNAQMKLLREGRLEMSDGTKPLPVEVEPVERSLRGYARYRMVLREGKKREIREIVGALGRDVKRLKRIAYGPLELGAPQVGEWRRLSDPEIHRLRQCVGLAATAEAEAAAAERRGDKSAPRRRPSAKAAPARAAAPKGEAPARPPKPRPASRPESRPASRPAPRAKPRAKPRAGRPSGRPGASGGASGGARGTTRRTPKR